MVAIITIPVILEIGLAKTIRGLERQTPSQGTAAVDDGEQPSAHVIAQHVRPMYSHPLCHCVDFLSPDHDDK
jgi:hypothetical protein